MRHLHAVPDIDMEVIGSRPRGRGRLFAIGAISMGLVGLGVAIATHDPSKEPDFIIEGEAHGHEILGAVNLRCNENGVMKAIVNADVRLVTMDDDKQDARGRVVISHVRPGPDDCEEAVPAVMRRPQEVLDGVVNHVDDLAADVINHGSHTLAAQYLEDIEEARGKVATFFIQPTD